MRNEGLLVKSHVMLPGSYSANKIIIDFLQHQHFIHDEMLIFNAMTLRDPLYL